ncbi:MAG TPA: DUF2892 domain-containing protein [Opitutaceae bacterium]|nr:DUF2892 domain-containing protein [Opitutaceae bacterium]
MKPESLVRLLAGTVVLVGTALAWFVHPGWLLLPAFAGLNLLQSVVTGFCPPTFILAKLGWIHRDGLIHLGSERK